eukprot:5090638-Prymnesium_polylepis.1
MLTLADQCHLRRDREAGRAGGVDGVRAEQHQVQAGGQVRDGVRYPRALLRRPRGADRPAADDRRLSDQVDGAGAPAALHLRPALCARGANTLLPWLRRSTAFGRTRISSSDRPTAWSPSPRTSGRW